jgi:SAM-dependent methyltransferase
MPLLDSTSLRAPVAVGWAVRRGRELLDPLAVRRARHRRGEGVVAIPPRRLRARTGAPGVGEFIDGGRQAAGELAAALEPSGRTLEQVGSVLDLGCGSARVLPHIAALAPNAACSGCDVDAAAVAWASRHHPDARWSASRFEPPLPFADRSFELVYSISVFSHLDERLQDRWLEDVRRVLTPGGVALLSVHGAHAFEQFRSGTVRTSWCRRDAFERGPLEPGELVFEPYRRSIWVDGELPGVSGAYGLAFHGTDYLQSHWSGSLRVIAVQERALTSWQDLVVCERG